MKALRLLVSEIDVLKWKWPPFFKWLPKCRIELCGIFGNTFSETCASQYLHKEAKLKVLRLLVSEIAAILENGHHKRPGVIWLDH